MSEAAARPTWAVRIDVVGITSLLAITALVAAGLIVPAYRARQRAQQTQVRLRSQKQNLAKASATLKSIQAVYQHAKATVVNHPLHLAPATALNQRLSRLTGLAAGRGLEVDSIEPGQQQVMRHYVRQPIAMTGEGGFQAAVRFLHGLHQKMPDIAVRSFALTGSPGQTSRPPTFRFRLWWFAAPADNS